MIRPDSPRRYIVDERGRRVLFGLTPSETSEFEKLDGRFVSAGTSEQSRTIETSCATPGESRWLELYAKHDSAWHQWKSMHSPGFFPAA